MFSVYIITNLVNDKRYVGITNTTVEQRFKRHVAQSNHPTPRYVLHKAMKKYGVNAFSCNEYRSGLSMEEAKHLEIQLIAEYQTFYVDHPNLGYNMTRGGDGIWGYRHSDTTKQKMRLVNLGKTYSATHRKNISDSKIGKSRPAHVQEILKECRAKYCGSNGTGANNPNAKRWKLTNTKTNEVTITDDFKKWCAEHNWNYSSACSARHHNNLYKREWRIAIHSPSAVESITPNDL